MERATTHKSSPTFRESNGDTKLRAYSLYIVRHLTSFRNIHLAIVQVTILPNYQWALACDLDNKTHSVKPYEKNTDKHNTQTKIYTCGTRQILPLFLSFGEGRIWHPLHWLELFHLKLK